MTKKSINDFGCDMIVIRPELSENGCWIYGKNSDLTTKDVQEISYFPAKQYESGKSLQVTHIRIPQARETHAIVASKPAWSWGIEMGANEYGVVMGSVAMHCRLRDKEDKSEKLVDIDINRLALERGRSASECLEVAINLIEGYGQGGIMTETLPNAESYDSGYLIVDKKEAWLLETYDRHWAARLITEPWFNISNHYTISTNYTRLSPYIKQLCVEQNLCTDEEPFNWFACLGKAYPNTLMRKQNGEKLIKQMIAASETGKLGFRHVADFLRDREAGINRTPEPPNDSDTTSSQISLIPASSPSLPAIHFITATPDPAVSLFKPIVMHQQLSSRLQLVKSPIIEDDPADPDHPTRFAYLPDRRHPLYLLHEQIRRAEQLDQDKCRHHFEQLEVYAVEQYQNALKMAKLEIPHDETDRLISMFERALKVEEQFLKEFNAGRT